MRTRLIVVLSVIALLTPVLTAFSLRVWAQQTPTTQGETQFLFLPSIQNGSGAGPSPTPSATPSVTATATANQSPTPSVTATGSPTPTATATATATASATPTATATASATATPTATATEVSSGLPPDPSEVAPPLDQTVSTGLLESTAFLYTGSNPIQTGVLSGTIELRRVAVLRGRVVSRDDEPVPGVTISVLDHPEFGRTLTREDGMFDLAVNGGGLLVVQYEREGFLPAQRQVNAPWQDYIWLPDVVLIPLDSQVTTIDLAPASAMQVVRGSVISDTDGSRQATVLFPQGMTATMVLSDGTTSPLTTLAVRATEYTVGANGPNAMPGELPPSSGYTYAVELSVDEALAAGAQGVRFSAPVPFYVENFVGIPVGSLVPAGFYDRSLGRWVAADNGRVIKLVSISGGLANLDLDGNGLADDAAAQVELGISDAERQRLAALYPPGQELWRVLLPHLTPWDFNWPYGPPPGSLPPGGSGAPKPGPKPNKPPKNPNNECRSIIGCEPQTLGEVIDVTGTPFRLHYQSDRTPGYRDTDILTIRLTGATLPADLHRIHLEIAVAGQTVKKDFAPQANLIDTFAWDGKDAYGRPVQGIQPVKVRIGYAYIAQYYTTPDSFAASFNRFGYPPIGVARGSGGGGGGGGGGAVSFSSVPLRATTPTITLWQDYKTSLGSLDSRGLGGWSLSIQHIYDVAGQTLYLGDGDRRSAISALDAVITTVAGNGVSGGNGDDGPATAANLYYPRSVAIGLDGSLYIADSTNRRIRRVGLDGIITTVAGNGTLGSSGDGGPASEAGIGNPRGITVGADGSLYITADSHPNVRRVGPDGIITTVAGNGTIGFSGDGGLAVEASLDSPYGVAIGPDGSLYIADLGNNRIRRVGSDGLITTVAGNGTLGSGGDGGLATAAALWNPRGLAVGEDGSLLIADYGNSRIRQVGPDGIITTVAGSFRSYQPTFSGDGGPATEAILYAPTDVATGVDGSLYIADWGNRRIRRVGPDGIITTVAGNGNVGFSGDSGPAAAASFREPSGVAVAPDGSLYIADTYNLRIRRVASPLPGADITDILLPSEDGSELYLFDRNGRHLKTMESLIGALRYQFNYDGEGYLTSITDGDGNVTSIERSGATATAIVAPGGQRTALGVNGNGWLSSVTNPAGETHTMGYSTEGLLQQFVDPRAHVHTFTYDELGRLIKDEDPVGGSVTLVRTGESNNYTVTTTSALGRVRVYQVEELSTGALRHSVTQPSGARTVTLINTDGSETITYPDGTVVTVQYGPDPRWGMLAPVATRATKTPSGLTRTLATQRSVTFSDPTDLMSMIWMTETITDNGSVSTLIYDASARLFTLTTAAGRSGTWKVDGQGRVVQAQLTGLAAINLVYNGHGLLSSVTEGSAASSHTTNFLYNGARDLTGISDALGRTTNLVYDAVGRPITQTLPDDRMIGYAYDTNGNLTGLTPPGRPQHTFDYTAIDQVAQYTPPDVNPGSDQTQYSYNADRQLTTSTRPDGQTTGVGFDSAGRVNAVTIDRGQFGYTYNPTTSNLAVISAPGGITLTYTYDGGLVTVKSWSGPVAGSVGYVYDNRFRLISLTFDNSNAISFQYDSDNLLTQAGTLTLNRNPQNGLLTGSALGTLVDTWTYNSFAEPIGYSALYNATPLYSVQVDRDKLGRIIQKSETIDGATAIYSYTYDLAGRLTGVQKNGLVVESYTYDTNGNRLSGSTAGGTLTGVYDAQDRLTHYGATIYTHTAAGEMTSKTNGGQTTSYSYDELGNLLGVTLPDGTAVTYVIDGENQRIGKQVNGVLVQGFLYESNLRPIAELDGSGALVSRFVYATHINVPDYLVKGGVTYRILTDHLGSPRLVVNAATGAIVQRMDFDSFGKVLTDTNPGFQPFGFAGGLYDLDTRLVRFGARNYDADTGRWTAQDPIKFSGNDTNLYAYSFNDPVNFGDPNGYEPYTCRGYNMSRIVGCGLCAASGYGVFAGPIPAKILGVAGFITSFFPEIPSCANCARDKESFITEPITDPNICEWPPSPESPGPDGGTCGGLPKEPNYSPKGPLSSGG